MGNLLSRHPLEFSSQDTLPSSAEKTTEICDSVELSLFEAVINIKLPTGTKKCQVLLLGNSLFKRSSNPIPVEDSMNFLDCHWSVTVKRDSRLVIGLKSMDSGALIGFSLIHAIDQSDWTPLYTINYDHPNGMREIIGSCELTAVKTDKGFVFRVNCSLEKDLPVSGRLWMSSEGTRGRLVCSEYGFNREVTLIKPHKKWNELTVEVQINGHIIGSCKLPLIVGKTESNITCHVKEGGKIRYNLNLVIQDHKILPIDLYTNLQDLILTNYKHTASLLVTRKCDYSQRLVQSLVNLTLFGNVAVEFLLELFKLELDKIDEGALNSAFRGNSIGTKCIECFQGVLGNKEYVTSVYGIVVSQLEQEPSLTPESVLNAILSAIGKVKIPNHLRRLYAGIKKEVSTKFPRPSLIHIHSITGFLFMRLHLPVILNPSLIKGDIGERLHRVLGGNRTLIAKLFNKLSSLTEFPHGDELYVYNSQLRLHFPHVCMIVMQVTEDDHRRNNASFPYKVQERQADLYCLHLYFAELVARYPSRLGSMNVNTKEQRSSILSVASSTKSLLREQPLDPEGDSSADIGGWWVAMTQCVLDLNKAENKALDDAKRAANETITKLRRSSVVM